MQHRDICDACGGRDRKPFPADTIWPVVVCSCGFVYLSCAPEYAALASDLAWEKTSLAEKKRRRSRPFGWLDEKTRWRMKIGHIIDRRRNKAILGGQGSVLDIGCGPSCRVPPGPIPFGIEISESLAEMAVTHFAARGGRVVTGPALHALDLFPNAAFSAILMRSYLEHEAAPLAVLRKGHAKLAPGGIIHVRVPDFGSLNRRVMGKSWCGYRFPDHVNYFTGVSLRAMAARAGLAYRRLNWLSPFDDNIIAELSKRHLSCSGEDDLVEDDGRLHVVVGSVTAGAGGAGRYA